MKSQIWLQWWTDLTRAITFKSCLTASTVFVSKSKKQLHVAKVRKVLSMEQTVQSRLGLDGFHRLAQLTEIYNQFQFEMLCTTTGLRDHCIWINRVWAKVIKTALNGRIIFIFFLIMGQYHSIEAKPSLRKLFIWEIRANTLTAIISKIMIMSSQIWICKTIALISATGNRLKLLTTSFTKSHRSGSILIQHEATIQPFAVQPCPHATGWIIKNKTITIWR